MIKLKQKVTALDLLALILLPAVGTLITLVLSVNLLVSTILLYGGPIIYLSLKRIDLIPRTSLYAATVTVISIYTDYLAERDQSWVSSSSFEFRLAGVVPVEALLWVFMLTYLLVIFYQYFFDGRQHPLIGRRFRYVMAAAVLVLAWSLVLHFTGIFAHRVNYYYIKFGLAFILLPLIVFLCLFPKYLRRLLIMIPYFTAIGLTNVIVSLHKGHWSYPGNHFIGWVDIFGARFPVEELIFWIILYTPFLITQFEFFNNDRLENLN